MNSVLLIIIIIIALGIPLGLLIGVGIVALSGYTSKLNLKKKEFKIKQEERLKECKEAQIKRNDKQLQRESKYPNIFLRDRWDEKSGSIPEAIIKRKDAVRHQSVITGERRNEEISPADTTNREIERPRSIQPTVITDINRRNNDDNPKPRETKRKFNWD